MCLITLGVLTTASEYGTGMIRTTMVAYPQPRPGARGKDHVVFFLLAFVVTLVCAAVVGLLHVSLEEVPVAPRWAPRGCAPTGSPRDQRADRHLPLRAARRGLVGTETYGGWAPRCSLNSPDGTRAFQGCLPPRYRLHLPRTERQTMSTSAVAQFRRLVEQLAAHRGEAGQRLVDQESSGNTATRCEFCKASRTPKCRCSAPRTASLASARSS
ncbi:hypothetical protein SALBM217S_02791 [Streptomyces griseoloalbus]